MSERSDDHDIGYGNPPVATRFRKGESGNPKGRPPGRVRGVPFETVLGQLVTIRDGGQERRVPAAEAFLLQLAKQGLEGDGSAIRATLRLIDEARQRRLALEEPEPVDCIVILKKGHGANEALEYLRMGRKLNRYSPSACMKLEPWIIEAALARLDRKLTREEQETVLAATRTPGKVKWPDWWEAGAG